MHNGRIPKIMVAYLKPSEKRVGDGNCATRWSFPTDRRETAGFEKYDASEAFVVPEDSEAFNKSAMSWACGINKWDTRTPKPEEISKVTKASFTNKAFTNLRWVGVDSRMEGGVAYKVVTQEGWLVDLREDVLIDCLYEGEIKQLKNQPQGAGTYFTAQFVWVVMGSQSRIVRVGSTTYQDIVKSQELSETKTIPEKDLEVGGVYQDRKRKGVIILARGTNKGEKFLKMEISRYNRSALNLQEEVDGSIAILDGKEKNRYPCWYFSGAMTVVKKVGQVKVPDGLIPRYKQKMNIVTGRQIW